MKLEEQIATYVVLHTTDAFDWRQASLGEVADFEMGQAPPGTECNKEGIGTVFVKAGEFGSLYPVEVEWTTKPLKYGKKGDVFICVVGATAGKLNLGIDCAIGRSVAAIRPKEGVDTKFIYYQLQPWVLKLRASSSGSAQGVISKAQLSEIPLLIGSLDQQKRIVAEIEKQFSRLDEAVANLKRVKANLKRYKAAVLKAAVEGRLVETEAEIARREGRSYETGKQLLQRILETRRSQWQGKGKYKEPAAPDTTDLPELPDGWVWASLEQLVENFDGVRVPVRSKDREGRQGPYPYYGASGVIDHVDDYLFDGDYLLIAEDGANLLSRTTPIAFQASGKFWVNNHAHIIQTLGGMPLAFLEHYLNGKDLARLVTGSAQPKLTQAAMNRIPVPLPSAAEQNCIVAEVDRRLSILRETEAQVDANLQRAERMRQSILASAFSGKLQ